MIRAATPVRARFVAVRGLRPALGGLAVLVMLVAAMAACGVDDGSPEPSAAEGVRVRPVAEIIVGEIVVTGLSPASATIEVETSVDVACSVVYGPGREYGSQSTDPAMTGQGHRDHAAPLRGLEPDTVYHYRLQGSAADGTLYVSDDLTFRTPPADAETGGDRPNLASLGGGARVVEVSSVFGDSASWGAERAIDGDPSTEWSSAGDGNEAFIVIELAAETDLAALGLWTRTMTASAQIARFRVVTDRGEVLGPFDVSDADGLHVFEVAAVAHTLRFEVVESSGGNTGIVELAAYATELTE